MAEPFIPYARQSLDDDDIAAVVAILKGDWLTQGPTIAAFEAAVAERVGARHAVAVATGTAALHAACFAAGIGPGDDVVTTPITFAASGNCALYLGGEVRFADIRDDTYCLDPAALEAAMGPRTKAVVPVDFAGQPADLDDIRAIAHARGAVVIEDAAHAIGATYRGRPVGTLADMTVFSFHPAKQMTSGEGGMVVTDSDAFAARLRLFRTHGITQADDAMRLPDFAADADLPETRGRNARGRAGWYYEMQALGHNLRITDIQCALGLSQLGKLDRFLERRRAIAARYTAAFAASPHLIVPHQEPDRQSAWHLYMLRLRLDTLRRTRRDIFDALRARGIGAHVHYIPLHLQPFYRDRYGHGRGRFPMAETYYDSALTIPLYPAMSDADVARVIDTVMQEVS